jgi:4-hydroxy-3-methylbut-2-enyl diphosphate reductase
LYLVKVDHCRAHALPPPGQSIAQVSSVRVMLAQPRGFCAGVIRAIDIVEQALARFGAPVYVRHEIVHNRHVVDGLRAKGARFVESLEEIPAGAITVFSAHGVARAVEDDAGQRALHVLDATCPLVAKVHGQGQRYVAQGRVVVLIGHAGHPEVEGTMGQIPGRVELVQDEQDVAALDLPRETPVAYVTQTTLSVDDTRGIIAALERRFDDLVGPSINDICYATQNRQSAVRELAKVADVILVVGAKNSSNSNRLREIGVESGVPSHLIADGSELDAAWVRGARVVGLTAGASAPETLVGGVIDALASLGPVEVSVLPGIEEKVEFRLPAELLRPRKATAGAA